MIISHKIELILNEEQRIYCCKAAGVARFSYNWALNQWKNQYELYKNGQITSAPNNQSLRKQLNSIKKKDFPWMLEVTKYAPQQAIMNLGEAFSRFFKKNSQYPQFKKKYKNDSFYLGNDVFKIDGFNLQLPKIKKKVKLTEKLRFNGKIVCAVISRIAHKWFISVNVEVEDQPKKTISENQTIVGVDLGVTDFATLYDGSNCFKINGIKSYKAKLQRIKLLSHRLSKKEKDSNNKAKSKLKLAKLHMQVANIRKDFIHKFTTELVNKYDVIVIETLNVKGMVKNHHLAQSILDRSFYEFKRQLEYKSKMVGTTIFKADQWFASSKLCSACNIKNENLKLSDRSWTCVCGVKHDRDENASKNLRKLYVDSLSMKVCGKKSTVQKQSVSETTILDEAKILTNDQI